MIFRLGALVLDAWLSAAHALRGIWRTFPGDLLGRLVMSGCGIGSGTGVGLAPDVRAILVEDRRAARYLDRMPVRPTAQTLGRYVVAREPISALTLAHELEHVRQWERLGPFFLPAYIASSGLAATRGDHPYRANLFERAARRRAELDESLVRTSPDLPFERRAVAGDHRAAAHPEPPAAAPRGTPAA